MTGAGLAPGLARGANTLSCRQSSLIGPLAPPALGAPSSRMGWGQEGPAATAGRDPVQACGAWGGAQRRGPTGGAA